MHFDFEVRQIAASNDGKWLSLTCRDRTIIYEWKSRAIVHTQKFYKKGAVGVSEQRVVAGGKGLCFYNLSTGYNEHSFETD